MTEWTKEEVYDAEINPLMAKIIAICKEHRIPLVAQFNYANEGDAGPAFCTTVLPASSFGRDDGGQSVRMAQTARPPSEFAAFTIHQGPR
jgi:hypothetical protein